jgi:hypothetical protein
MGYDDLDELQTSPQGTIQNSVTLLMKNCNVHCTGVFRMPLARQVNILTRDEIQLAGVNCVNNKVKFSSLLAICDFPRRRDKLMTELMNQERSTS